jgi:hypothetical protein
MRFIFADPGLRDNAGHYATHCRWVTGELRKRGIAPTVLAYKKVDQALREELGALPFFDIFTNWFSDGDPICGALNAFHIAAEATHKNLASLADIGANDFIYFSSARPAQFYAIVRWLMEIPPERMPRVLAGFANDPGLDLTADKKSYAMRDPRDDPSAMLYRFVACRMAKSLAGRLHLATFEKVMSQVYGALLKYPVGVLPMLRVATGPLRKRGQKLPITISVLGVQRSNKGYHLMPDVIRGVLQAHPNVRLIVHNSAPADMPEQQKAIRAIAVNEPRVIVDERLVAPEIWAQLLEASDLILCPYHPMTFYACPSGVAMEAVANAIPFVGPAETALHRLIQEYGCGTVFDRFEANSIIEAIGRALANFDHFAGIAVDSAKKYAVTHGPAQTVNAMLHYAHTTGT